MMFRRISLKFALTYVFTKRINNAYKNAIKIIWKQSNKYIRLSKNLDTTIILYMHIKLSLSWCLNLKCFIQGDGLEFIDLLHLILFMIMSHKNWYELLNFIFLILFSNIHNVHRFQLLTTLPIIVTHFINTLLSDVNRKSTLNDWLAWNDNTWKVEE